MDNPKISVIISIYNGENDVHIMLDSLIAQSFEDIEYILIDNGSEDNTRAVCQSYADRDKRFRVEVIEKNIGYIRARNVGLTLAKGEYITFADADDFLSEDAYRIMYDAVSKSDADMLIAPYNLVYPKGEIVNKPTNLATGTYNKEKIEELLLPAFFGGGKDRVRIEGFMWRMLFRREIVEKTKNIFYEEAKPKEDQIFNQLHSINCERIEVIDYPVYNYIINENSVTAKITLAFDYKDVWNKNLFLFDKSTTNAKRTDVYEKLEKSICLNIYETVYTMVINTAKTVKFCDIKRVAKDFEKLFDCEYVKVMYKNLCGVKNSFVDKMIMSAVNKNKYRFMFVKIKVLQKLRGGH
ncbi:MAG: glycosyltransferase family 2 protein [Clostridia bacterium]|nr:glycosyltransferase family 2 protein [Clostridia bacterium]